MTIRLNATQSKPAAAPKVASQYENRYPGFKLVEFRPYESVAILERLTDKQVSARGILANELGINPWQVQVEATEEGGWRCTLDRTVIYSPRKWMRRPNAHASRSDMSAGGSKRTSGPA
ncbi:MAG: hypothetical protein ACLRL4_10630 [Bifidobacterium bifidum]